MGRSTDLSVELGEREGNLYARAWGDRASEAQPILTRCLETISRQKVLAVRKNGRVFSLTQPPLPSSLGERALRLAAQLELSGGPGLTQATISLASTCPCPCWASAPDRDHGGAGPDLSTAEVISVLDQALDLGVVSIHFCGGEPVGRTDLVELIDHVDPDRAMVLLHTNGRILTGKLVSRLARSSIHAVIVHLDSPERGVHDARRKSEGLFDEAVSGVSRSVAAGLLTGLATVADQRLVGTGELERLVALARELEVAQVFAWHSLPAIVGGNGNGNGLRLTAEALGTLSRLATDLNGDPRPPSLRVEEGPLTWGSGWAGRGFAHLLVTARGSVQPYGGEKRCLGNVRDERLETIWSRARPLRPVTSGRDGSKTGPPRPVGSVTSVEQPSAPRRIGLLAGSGQYPIHFARGAKQCGHQVVALAIEQEADAALAKHVDEIHWVGVGQLQKIFDTLKGAGIGEIVLTGKIHKTHLFSHVELDGPMIRVLSSLTRKDDLSLLLAISDEFELAGIAVREPTLFLKNLQASPGVLTKRSPTASELADVQYGYTVAKSLADHGIGQTVVVKDGIIVAVEAIEGTDEAILRAGTLVPDMLVVVKVGCPNQDRRFDMPVVGMETLRTLVAAHAAVLAIDAANTVIVEKEAVVEEADRHQIAIIAL
jgi:DUF1009 family protein/MoaA/NifB/PqqE/SkfB family radical SAM enzyme